MNIVLYDWFSMTSKIDSPETLKSIIGLDKVGILWQPCNGMHGYRDRYSYEGINIHYNGREDMGVWLEMSGKGCRTFETLSETEWSVLFWLVLNDTWNYHVTRLDVAYDDKDGVLSLEKLYRETENQNYTSRFSSYQLTKSNKGVTVYFGSNKSNVVLRFYDKAMERGLTDGSHWVRCEFQLRDDKALNFLKLAGTVGENFFSVMNNYLRFVKSDGDSNLSRRPTANWWLKFLENLQKVSIYTPCNMDYNLERLEKFTFHQCGNAISTYLKIKGYSEFDNKLRNRNTSLSKKYQNLINVNGEIDSDPVLQFLAERGAL